MTGLRRDTFLREASIEFPQERASGWLSFPDKEHPLRQADTDELAPDNAKDVAKAPLPVELRGNTLEHGRLGQTPSFPSEEVSEHHPHQQQIRCPHGELWRGERAVNLELSGADDRRQIDRLQQHENGNDSGGCDRSMQARPEGCCQERKQRQRQTRVAQGAGGQREEARPENIGAVQQEPPSQGEHLAGADRARG